MNILEEYLVKIGFDVRNNGEASQALRTIQGMTDAIGKLGTVLKAGGIAALIAKLTDSIVENIKAVAKADLEYEKLAKEMWVSKETAKSLSVILKTMGVSEKDVAWVPELREQFFRLRGEMAALATPIDSDSQLKWIRQIGYDIESLQLKFKMLKEWFVYYLIKYMQPIIKEFQDFIRWLNDVLGKNMPQIAKEIAKWAANFMSVVATLFRVIKDGVTWVYGVFERLPSKIKSLVPAFAAAGALIMASPFGMMLAAIGGALLLLQDFYYYLDGKRSSKALAPMWESLIKFANGTGASFLDGITHALGEIKNALKEIFEGIDFDTTINSVKQGLKDIWQGFNDIIEAHATLLKKLNLSTPEFKRFFDTIGYAIGGAVRAFGRVLSFIGRIMGAIALALEGKYSDAAEVAGVAVKELAKETIKDTVKGLKNMFWDSAGNDGNPFIPKSMKISEGDNPDLTHISDKLKFAEPYIGGLLNSMGITNPEITSGYRSPAHNAAIGGAANSWHTHGEAMDIFIGNPDPITAEAIKERFKPYFEEVLYHDAGSGMHLHVANYKGGLENIAGAASLNPNSYAATQAYADASVSSHGGAGGSFGSTSYNYGGSSIGSVIINITAPDAKAAGIAVAKTLADMKDLISVMNAKGQAG